MDYSQEKCDRCPNTLRIRTLSWFTNDTICMTCSDAEKLIKRVLRKNGIADAMEGCGFIPKNKAASLSAKCR